jgi:hypothetical protein
LGFRSAVAHDGVILLSVREPDFKFELSVALIGLPQRLAGLWRAVLERDDEQGQPKNVVRVHDVRRVWKLHHDISGHRFDAIERVVSLVHDGPVAEHDAVLVPDDELIQRVHARRLSGALLKLDDERLLVRRVDGEPAN